MRIASGIVVCCLAASQLFAQEKFSDAKQYEAYQKGDWETVVDQGKLAKKQGVDYYYIRARNGYAYMMKGNYRRAEKELDKALKFNTSDEFSKRYAYWSAIYTGESDAARLYASTFSKSEKELIKVIKPKLLSNLSLIGGYRNSTSPNTVSGMPYIQFNLGHELGGRFRLDQAINYQSVTRNSDAIWQVGYLAQIGVQASKTTTFRPFFIMQYWELSEIKIYDFGAGLSFRQRLGTVDLSAFGGYMQRYLDHLYQAGVSLSWYPLGNSRLYFHTSNSVSGGDGEINIISRETIGGNFYKGLWLSSTFVSGDEVIPFEAGAVNFSNTSADELNWRVSVTPAYYIKKKYGISLSYSAESRTESISQQNYNYHSFYLGFNVKL